MSVKKFFRVTPEEDAVISSSAAEAGLEPSSYMRIQTLGKSQIRAARRIRVDWDKLRRYMGDINKAGNVVNQLVVMLRRVGGRHDLADTALTELASAAHIIAEALREV